MFSVTDYVNLLRIYANTIDYCVCLIMDNAYCPKRDTQLKYVYWRMDILLLGNNALL